MRQTKYDPLNNYGGGPVRNADRGGPLLPREVYGLSGPRIRDTANPAGVVQIYAGSTPPEGWLLCNGQSVSRSSYPRLFTAISTTYGATDATVFNVPDMRGRTPVGYDVTQAEFDTLGETGGEKTHILTIPEMPSHSHTYGSAVSLAANGAVHGTAINNNTYTSSSTGGDGAHNNLQPYISVNYIIKY